MIILHQEVRDIVDVVDAALQFVRRAEVVDADQQGLALARALAVLEGVVIRCAVSEALLALRHNAAALWWAVVIAAAAAAAILLGRRLVVLLLLGRGIATVLLRRRRSVLVLLLLRVVAIVGLRRSLVAAIAAIALRWRTLTVVTAAGAVTLSWKHADADGADGDAV